MGDSNDIQYEGFQIDFIYIGRQLFDLFGVGDLSFQAFVSSVETAWHVITILGLIASFILMIGIVYAYIRYNQMGALETLQVTTQERLYQELYGKTKNDRFEDMQRHIARDNPNDWKLAIIEADVMLEQALDGKGYAGMTIGDKLKSVSPNALQTLDEAWKAHKVRNQIAHGGADFVLTKKLAQETMVQYQMVLRELGAI